MVALQYAPAYDILINGDDLPAAVRTCITSVRYEEGLNGADQVQIALANPDLQFLQNHIRGLSPIAVPLAINVNTIRRFGVLPSGLFDIDNRVRLSMG
jgi:hypothetical protein